MPTRAFPSDAPHSGTPLSRFCRCRFFSAAEHGTSVCVGWRTAKDHGLVRAWCGGVCDRAVGRTRLHPKKTVRRINAHGQSRDPSYPNITRGLPRLGSALARGRGGEAADSLEHMAFLYTGPPCYRDTPDACMALRTCCKSPGVYIPSLPPSLGHTFGTFAPTLYSHRSSPIASIQI